jgi:hypothetical protein
MMVFTMRRSTTVVAPLLATAAVALLSGCHQSPEMQRCVDEQNHVVDPSFCKNLPATSQQPAANHGSGLFIPPLYHYYYGGWGGYGLGSLAGGGAFAPAPRHSYSFSGGTSRGGFGSSFSGTHGGGAGE